MMLRRSPLAALILSAPCALTACSDGPDRGGIGLDAQVGDAQVALPLDAAAPDARPPYWELDAGPYDGGAALYDAFVPVIDVPACDRDAGPCAPHALAAGGDITCVAWAGGDSACWGGINGRAGDVTVSRSGVGPARLAVTGAGALAVSQYGELWASISGGRPARVGLGTRFRALSASERRACVLRDDGAPSCFAVDAAGLPSEAPDGAPEAAATGLALTHIANTAQLTCGLDRAGALVCWGEEEAGSLAGKGTLAAPTTLHAGPYEELELAPGATCVRSAAGTVACWGTRYGGGPKDAEPTPIALPGPARDFDLGARHGCAVVAGSVYCWGDGSDGQLGLRPLLPSLTPREVPGVRDAVYVATGEAHSCAVTADAHVYCWGSNLRGAVVPSFDTQTLPTPLRGFDGSATYRDVAVDARGGCAVEQSGEVTCWATPSPQVPYSWRPARVPSDGGFERVAVRDALGCGLTGEGALYCWSTDSPLLAGPAPSAIRVQPGLSFTDVSLARETICAITSAQALVCWGSNTSDLLGTPYTSLPASTVPQPVLPARSFTRVAVGESAAAAIDTTGRVYQWGQRGDGSGSTTPAAVTLPASATALAAGAGYFCALVTGGALYCWGPGVTASNAGATTSPTRIGSATGLRSLSARRDHVCALDAQGHAQCFGATSLGQSALPTPYGEELALERVSVDNGVFAGLDAAGRLVLGFTYASRDYVPNERIGYEMPTPTLHP